MGFQFQHSTQVFHPCPGHRQAPHFSQFVNVLAPQNVPPGCILAVCRQNQASFVQKEAGYKAQARQRHCRVFVPMHHRVWRSGVLMPDRVSTHQKSLG